MKIHYKDMSLSIDRPMLVTTICIDRSMPIKCQEKYPWFLLEISLRTENFSKVSNQKSGGVEYGP